MEIKKLISKFITNIFEKNYSEADKTLKTVVEAKVVEKIEKESKKVKGKKNPFAKKDVKGDAKKNPFAKKDDKKDDKKDAKKNPFAKKDVKGDAKKNPFAKKDSNNSDKKNNFFKKVTKKGNA